MAEGAALQRVLAALQRAGKAVRPSGGDAYLAQCPAHDDRNPSMSVTAKDGKVVLHCHAGCETRAVLELLGLRLRDLFDAAKEAPPKPQIVATYDYTDESGALLFQKVRYEPKTFRVRRPDGTGGWIYSIGDVRRVLYNLPAVLDAVREGHQVVVVEGEKDADRLIALGEVATCNFDGASKNGNKPKWQDRYSDVLIGAHVLIIADNDPEGIAHAKAVESSLHGKSASILLRRGVLTTVKSDISDHLDAGFGLDDLVPLPQPETNGHGPYDIETPEGDGDSGVRRPALRVDNSALAADWLRMQIGAGPLSGLFNRDGMLVHTPAQGEDGYIPPPSGHDGPAQVRVATDRQLRARIQYTYECYRIDKDGNRIPTMFPLSAAGVASDVIDMLPNLRWLRGVTHTPTVRADGSILHEPGYDAATGLLYLPEPGLEVPEVGTDTDAALELIEQMIAGFSFVAPAYRVNYIGLLLTPLLRELAPPPYKLGAITAPQPGSGKTLLANILRIIHGGPFRGMPEDDAELRKTITSVLDVTTGPVVVLDNVDGVLRSPTLSRLLTSADWGDRLLGSMVEVSRRNDRLWVVTGNNLRIDGDLPRRTVMVTIDPQCPNPHLRTDFAIPHLEGWVTENRGRLLCALLTLIRAWALAGQPGRQRCGDSFGPWIRAVDGILANAGLDHDFDSADTAPEGGGSETDNGRLRVFLVAARACFGSEPWTVRELLNRVHTPEPPPDLAGAGNSGSNSGRSFPFDSLPPMVADKIEKEPQKAGLSLGAWLRRRRSRYAGELAVVPFEVDEATNSGRWRVIAYGDLDGPSEEDRPELPDLPSAKRAAEFISPIGGFTRSGDIPDRVNKSTRGSAEGNSGNSVTPVDLGDGSGQPSAPLSPTDREQWRSLADGYDR